MNQSLKEIYDDYRYQLTKIEINLREIPEQYSSTVPFTVLMDKKERLETLVDLYAFLLVNQEN